MVAARVRPGEPDDLAEIVAIYNHYVEHTPVSFELDPVRAEDRRAWLAEHRSGGRYRILVHPGPDGHLLGWATTSPFRPRAGYATTVEASVYCRPDARGQGVGSELYGALFRAIQEEDLERIVAGITLPNPASVALHRRFGFRPVGVFTRVGRKFGKFWDVAWFERDRPRAAEFAPGGSPSHSIEETSERR
jgi:phosphinothricin acetyltransferase